jgi:hypothetical protein
MILSRIFCFESPIVKIEMDEAVEANAKNYAVDDIM